MELAVPIKDVGKRLADNDYAKDMRNAAYLAMLEQSRQELRDGKIIIKTLSELEAMAGE